MKKLPVFLLLPVLLVVWGCDRSRKGPMSEPAAGISSISGSVSIVDKGNFPYSNAYAQVKDNNGNVVTDFKLGNVNITEDGRPVVSTDLEKSLSPLAIVLILDRSGSMAVDDAYKELNAAASAFIDKLSEIDFVEIIEFGTDIKVSQTFTNDKDRLKGVIESGGAGMVSTPLYDAIGRGIDEIQQIGGHRVVIAMSDGWDTSSTKYNIFSIASYAISKNQAVNTIGYGGDYGLSAIAAATGGTFISASTGDELYQAYQNMIPDVGYDHIKIQFRSLSKKADKISVYLVYGSLTCQFSKDYPDTN